MGFIWSLANPLLMMGVFFLVFQVLLRSAPPQNCDINPGSRECRIYYSYTAFILVGIMAWNFTSTVVTSGMMSLLGYASMIKKIYFPREVLPISTALGLFVNFLLSLIPLTFVIWINGIGFSWLSLMLPLFLFFHLLFLMGVALFLSVVVVYLRDLAHIIDVILTAWFFLTPILYSMDQVFPTASQIMYWVNPIASFIESYRAILFFHYPPALDFTLRTCLSGLVTFLLGYYFFIKTSRNVGEVL